jgi:hypothetical protein
MKRLYLSKENNPTVEVQIHDSNLNSLGIYAKPRLQGFFSPSIRYTGQDKAGTAGHIVTGLKYGGRALPINGFIQAETITAYNSAVEQLANILSLEEDQYGRPVKLTLRMISDTDREYTIPVVLRDDPELPDENLLYGEYSLPLFAPDPMFRQLPQIVSSQLDISQNLGALLPALAPFRLGTSHGSQLILYNNGNVDVFPVLRLYGQLTNPSIINETTNQFFKLSYTFGDGTSGTIDMSKGGDAIANGVTSINNSRASGSVAWPLLQGANTISLQTSNDSDDGYVTVEYYQQRTNIR